MAVVIFSEQLLSKTCRSCFRFFIDFSITQNKRKKRGSGAIPYLFPTPHPGLSGMILSDNRRILAENLIFVEELEPGKLEAGPFISLPNSHASNIDIGYSEINWLRGKISIPASLEVGMFDHSSN